MTECKQQHQRKEQDQGTRRRRRCFGCRAVSCDGRMKEKDRSEERRRRKGDKDKRSKDGEEEQ